MVWLTEIDETRWILWSWEVVPPSTQMWSYRVVTGVKDSRSRPPKPKIREFNPSTYIKSITWIISTFCELCNTVFLKLVIWIVLVEMLLVSLNITLLASPPPSFLHWTEILTIFSLLNKWLWWTSEETSGCNPKYNRSITIKQFQAAQLSFLNLRVCLCPWTYSLNL